MHRLRCGWVKVRGNEYAVMVEQPARECCCLQEE